MKQKRQSNDPKIAALIRRYPKARAFAHVTLLSASGRSIFTTKEKIAPKNVHKFFPPEGNAEIVSKILESLGLRVIAQNRITICVSAQFEDFQNAFGVRLTAKQYSPYITQLSQKVTKVKSSALELFHNRRKELPIPSALQFYVEKITLPGKVILLDEDPDPPNPRYHHLKVPSDVARQVNALACHHRGYLGRGLVLAMPDFGTFQHAYYARRDYHIDVDLSAFDDTGVGIWSEEYGMVFPVGYFGHGTAIAANAQSIAPLGRLIGVRQGDAIFTPLCSFISAADHNPDVITISWKLGAEDPEIPSLRTAIAQAIRDGITVCCACGNKGPVAFPSSIPEVISVGGAYADEQDALQASTYASSGQLPAIDLGRQMPDLVGMVDKALWASISLFQSKKV